MDRERRPDADLARASRRAVHRLDELADDREPEAGADPTLRAELVVEVEAVEGAGQVVFGDPRAVVHDLETSGCGEDPHGPAHRRRAERVLDEVREGLEHAIRIACRERVGLGHRVQADAERAGDRLVPLERGDRHLAEIDLLGPDRERAATQASQVEQVADEPLEPPRLALDHRARPGRLQHAVLERLGMTADRRQRGLQLVADGEEKRLLGLLRPLELGREVVERRGERRDLARPGRAERLGVLARRQGAARVGDARDRSRDRAREEQRDDRRERRSDETRDPEADGERGPVGGGTRCGTEQDDRLVGVLLAPRRGSACPARRRCRSPPRACGAGSAPSSGSRSSACAGVRIASRCSSVARNWPSSCSVPRAGFSRRCAAISSTWRSRAWTPACSSERRVRSAPATTVTTSDTSTVAEIPTNRRERRLTARACTPRRARCG